MSRFLIGRLAASVLLIVALLSTVFFIVHLAPGDPVDLVNDPDLDAAGRAALRHEMGLDRPLGRQYLEWISGVLLHLDFGRSLRLHRPVSSILGEAVPNTLLLTLPAYLVHLLVAVPLGVWFARRRGSRRERGATVGGLFIYSLPAFWLGLMLILVFSRWLGWLPSGGMYSTGAADLSRGARFWDLLKHLVMPVLVLGAASAMITARYLRNSMLEALGQDYILAGRARGLPENVLLWRHALRNALLPVVTLVGLNLPHLLGGAVVTEYVFAWPGMGRVAVEAIFARDYPVVMGATALSAVMVVAGNLLADLAYGLVDPRIRHRRGSSS